MEFTPRHSLTAMSNEKAAETLEDFFFYCWSHMSEEQHEAAYMAIESLKEPMLGYLRSEVPYRYSETVDVPEDVPAEVQSKAIAAIMKDDCGSRLVDGDALDNLLEDLFESNDTHTI